MNTQPTADQKRIERAKLVALKVAAERGWADVAAGRYIDLAEDELCAFIAKLGEHASRRCKDGDWHR